MSNPTWDSANVTHMQLAIASASVTQIVIMIVTGFALTKISSGKPPQQYHTMMETAPPALQ